MQIRVIGITGNFDTQAGCQLAEAYYLSVAHAGAIPFVIPPLMPASDGQIDAILDHIDALLLSGGADVNPLLMGEEPQPALRGINPRRDHIELRLAQRAYQRNMPILGICRGIQVLAAALGGTVVQDIQGIEGVIKHSQDAERWLATHTVTFDDGLLRDMFGSRLAVNSFHHQAVGEPGPKMRIVARSADGIVEAIESACHKPVIGVQWHPESFEVVGDHTMMPLFRWLASEADLYSQTMQLHHDILTLDSHEDTPMFFPQGVDFTTRDPRLKVSAPLMRDGLLDCGIQVAYQAQGPLDDEAHAHATQHAHDLLDGIHDMLRDQPDFAIATSADQLWHNKQNDMHSVMLGIENGYAFGADLANIEAFSRRGVVYCTLCHNGNNLICGSARPKPGEQPDMGLTDYGRQVVREMNRLHMLIDLSHASEQTFYDVLQISQRPVVCSHSCCRALCDHPRNITDRQMKALAEAGGVMQITFYDGFLRQGGGATIDDVLRHIDHAVAVMGIDHVGIGSDFDGDGGVPGINDVGDMPNLTRELLRRGYSKTDIQKLWGANFLRLI